MTRICVLVLLACGANAAAPAWLSGSKVGMPDCSGKACPTLCTCAESKCGSDLYTSCTNDSQCNTMLTCMLGCACNGLTCLLGCLPSSLDATSTQIKGCAIPCITGTDLGSCSADDTNRLWDEFLQKFDKSYAPEDEPMRKGIFAQSCHRALARNKKDAKAVFGITKFSDMLPKEFAVKQLGARPPAHDKAPKAPVHKLTGAAAPKSFDWRTKGAVTPVKNQGQCGSCWAFSATETIESDLILQTGNVTILSPQQITSCAGLDTSADGCGGGWPAWAYTYVKDAGGITTAKDYPYVSGTTGATGTCNKKADKYSTDVKSFKYAVTPCTTGNCNNQDEEGLAAALASTAPVSICVDATSWQDYTSGILSTGCPSAYADIDHCVQLVGYNKEGATPYWIVRNSWGTTWGENPGNPGYIFVKMGENLCGIADQATFVTDTANKPVSNTMVV